MNDTVTCLGGDSTNPPRLQTSASCPPFIYSWLPRARFEPVANPSRTSSEHPLTWSFHNNSHSSFRDPFEHCMATHLGSPCNLFACTVRVAAARRVPRRGRIGVRSTRARASSRGAGPGSDQWAPGRSSRVPGADVCACTHRCARATYRFTCRVSVVVCLCVRLCRRVRRCPTCTPPRWCGTGGDAAVSSSFSALALPSSLA